MAWIRSAMSRSDFGISAIFASTSASPSAFPVRPPRAALRSLTVSLRAAISSGERTSDFGVVRLADVLVAFIKGSFLLLGLGSGREPREQPVELVPAPGRAMLRVLDGLVAFLGRVEPRRDREVRPVADLLELDRLGHRIAVRTLHP